MKQQYPFVSMKEMVWILPGGRIHNFPYVWDYEWEVKPGYSQYGKGDLVLTDGKNDFMVLEAKWISRETGKTAVKRRKESRDKVRDQAKAYRNILQIMHPSCTVSAAILTNDPPDLVLKFLHNHTVNWLILGVHHYAFLTPSVQVID